MDQKFEKWERRLETIRMEIMDLVRNKHIFWKLGDIVKNNPKIQKPNSFYKFAGETYFAYAVMGVRRQIKPHKDSVSFAGLLEEIIEMPCVLSRKRFVALYKSGAQFEANHDFTSSLKEMQNILTPIRFNRIWTN